MEDIFGIIQGGIWKPASITEEPETILTKWQVYKVENPNGSGWDIHFHGWTGWEGRVCSAVQEFDKETMRGRTRSGRIYELKGSPGLNGDAEYTWHRWLNIYGNPKTENITEEYYDLS